MRRFLPCLVCGAALVPGVAHAEWQFDTSVAASITHTNNVALDLPANEQQDTIYSLSPTFILTQESARTNLGLRWNPQAIQYKELEGADNVFHIVDADFNAELVKERLFLDVAAAQFQTIVTPEGNFPINNFVATNNRADSRVVSVAPYWVQRWGGTELRIDASHTQTDFEDEALQNTVALQSNDANRAVFHLGSAPKDFGATWSLDYNYQRVDYEDAIPWEYQRASAQIGYWVIDTVRVFATGGQETAFDDFFTGKLEDDLWEAGIQYAPNSRLNLEVAAGERSFGSSRRAELTHTTSRWTTRLRYNEGPQTQGLLQAGRQPLRDTDNLDFLLDRSGDSDRLIRKRGELRTSLTLPKSTLTLRIFSERRTDRTTAEGSPLANDELTGAAFRFDWRFGSRTTLNFNLDKTDREGPILDGELWSVTVGAAYTLSSRVSLALNLRHAEQDGVGGRGGGPWYQDSGTLSVIVRL